MQMLHGIFDRSEDKWIGDVPRHPQDKNVSQSLIEDIFRRHARIGAGQDNRERVLALGQFPPTLRAYVRGFRMIGDKSFISLLEPFQSLLRRQGGLLLGKSRPTGETPKS